MTTLEFVLIAIITCTIVVAYRRRQDAAIERALVSAFYECRVRIMLNGKLLDEVTIVAGDCTVNINDDQSWEITQDATR